MSGAGPVGADPRYPHVGNLEPGQKTDRIADLNSPILQDWAKEQMKKTNDAVLRGRTPFVATSLCWPGGVPAQLLVPTTVFFIQKPNEIWMIWERDMLTRHIYLNQPHSKNPKPSWFGESVGHFENGDTLVIDTIGETTHPLSFVDNYRTPHSRERGLLPRYKRLPWIPSDEEWRRFLDRARQETSIRLPLSMIFQRSTTCRSLLCGVR